MPITNARITVECPADLVPFLERGLSRNGIPAGVTFNQDGSRTYQIDLRNHTVREIEAAIEEAVNQLRQLLTVRSVS